MAASIARYYGHIKIGSAIASDGGSPELRFAVDGERRRRRDHQTARYLDERIRRGPAGNVYFTSTGASTSYILKYVPSTQTFTTIAGSGQSGFAGDGAPATAARLNFGTFTLPVNLVLDARGNLFVADALNGRIRAIRGPIP